MEIIHGIYLKLCPICGWDMQVIDMGNDRYHLKCKSCLLRFGSTWGSDDSIEHLQSLWNNRKQDVTISKFVNKLMENQQDSPPEFSKIVDDNFWDLIDTDGEE